MPRQDVSGDIVAAQQHPADLAGLILYWLTVNVRKDLLRLTARLRTHTSDSPLVSA